MRKCFCVLVLILIFCLFMGDTSVVATDSEIAPNAAVGLSSGLTLVSGSTHRSFQLSQITSLPVPDLQLSQSPVVFYSYKQHLGHFTGV